MTVLRAFNLLDRSSTMLDEAPEDEEKIAGELFDLIIGHDFSFM